MKRNRVLKKTAVMALTASLVFAAAGCIRSVNAETYKTVKGVTEGNYEVSTEHRGSAGFHVEGNHVDMTNFSFDADPGLKVEAYINETDLVYTQVLIRDDENIIQNIADGHYPEIFTRENAADEFNTIYQQVFGAGDMPVTEKNVLLDRGVMYVKVTLTDGLMFLFAKEETDQYAMVAVTTDEYGSLDIINAAFDALNDESAPEAEEQPIEEQPGGEGTDEAEDAVVPEEDTETIYVYPVYSHETDDPFYAPACQYIMETCGPLFDPEDIMIPVVDILRVDDSDPEDILVWGNYRVYNYALRGTTLMTRSGGNFPGIIHMRKDGDSYTGVSMDLVEDGERNGESVKEIFGVDDELMKAYTESAENEELTEEAIRWYREDSGLDIEAYEDYGWDPHFLDPEADTEAEYPDLAGKWVADGAEMEIKNPDEGNVYEVMICVNREEGSKLRFEIYGEYEFSTGALYYWDGSVTLESDDGSEDFGNDAEGYLGLEDDGTIAWYSANDDAEIWFRRA